MLSTTDYIAYFNTFYQEVGSIVYLGFLIGFVLIIRHQRFSIKWLLVYFLAILLLCLTKTSNFYWSFVTLPFVLPWSQVRTKFILYIPLALLLAFLPAFLSITLTRTTDAVEANPYQSLFLGALTFSNDPQARLEELGYPPNTTVCIGVNAYSQTGVDCRKVVEVKLSFVQTALIDLREPGILIRQLGFAADQTQILSLDNLGKYAFGDNTTYHSMRLNIWSEIKKAIFPRGWLLVGILIIGMAGFGFASQKKGLIGDFASIGLLMVLGCFLEMNIAMIGEGKADIVKHLFLANLTFDLAFVSFLALAAAIIERVLPIYFKNHQGYNVFTARSSGER